MSRKNSIISLILMAVVILLLVTGFVLNRKDNLLIRNPVLIHEAPVITYISGEVYLLNAETGQWEEPAVGEKLEPGAKIKTMADGEIDIRANSSTLIRLDADTQFVLSVSTLKHLSLYLEKGRLFGKFQKLFPSQRIQVNTDDMSAGIRGTELVFEASSEKSTVYALSGITEVMNPSFPDFKLLLSFQKMVEILQGQIPGQPQEMAPETIRLFQETINSIHSEKVFLVTRAIRFRADTDTILEDSIPELERLFEQINRTHYKLQITGHTANIGAASAQYVLSLKRAQAVKQYLVERGISEKRLTVMGYGGTRPVIDNSTEAGKALNRRVEFIIIE